ncbi:RNA-dependent RNA polymerase [Sesbania bispinosa]|nr:RNA-dependent RNA polymerase [Sesbania bispinosa]
MGGAMATTARKNGVVLIGDVSLPHATNKDGDDLETPQKDPDPSESVKPYFSFSFSLRFPPLTALRPSLGSSPLILPSVHRVRPSVRPSLHRHHLCSRIHPFLLKPFN